MSQVVESMKKPRWIVGLEVCVVCADVVLITQAFSAAFVMWPPVAASTMMGIPRVGILASAQPSVAPAPPPVAVRSSWSLMVSSSMSWLVIGMR